MTRITARLGRIEDAVRPGQCRVCLGRGKASVPVVVDDAPSGVRGCPACGRVAASYKAVRLPVDDESHPQSEGEGDL